MSANPHANGGVLLRPLRLPEFRDYAVAVPHPGEVDAEINPRSGQLSSRHHAANEDSRNFRVFGPDETARTVSRTCSRQPSAPGCGDHPRRRRISPRMAGSWRS